MPFPYHDRCWTETSQFIKRYHHPGEMLLAPGEFVDEFPTTHAYAATFLAETAEYAWAVLHKGQLECLSEAFLGKLKRRARPVFANEVFVVYTRSSRPSRVYPWDRHYHSFKRMLAKTQSKQPSATALAECLKPRPDMSKLTTEQVAEEMNRRFANQCLDDEFCGYEHPFLWDKVRYREVDGIIQEMIGDVRGLSILELACGQGRQVNSVLPCSEYIGTDISQVALERVAQRYRDRPNIKVRLMDCQKNDFPEGRFDLVLAIEMIEHIHDVQATLAGAHRVLKPGGKLILNSANRDSLNLRMMRRIGLPDFRATSEHICELKYSEMKELLERIGFEIDRAEGSFLLPYYGIPKIDEHVRTLTNDDPETVEMFRELGRRAGPEYAYEYILEARKTRN